MENQNNGFANLLMGKAMMAKGKSAPAIPYLSNATLLIAEESSGWMLLAEAYQMEDQPKRVQETLQTAILTSPDSADINYALGESYRMTGSLSEALPYLKKAASLNPGSLSVALDLAKTLKALGYLKEAGGVYSGSAEEMAEKYRAGLCGSGNTAGVRPG